MARAKRHYLPGHVWHLTQKKGIGDQRSEVRDKVKTKFDIKIKDTHHLIEMIQNNKLPDKIMINVHPQRWNDDFIPWDSELVRQRVKNVVKRMINRRAEFGRQKTE